MSLHADTAFTFQYFWFFYSAKWLQYLLNDNIIFCEIYIFIKSKFFMQYEYFINIYNILYKVYIGNIKNNWPVSVESSVMALWIRRSVFSCWSKYPAFSTNDVPSFWSDSMRLLVISMSYSLEIILIYNTVVTNTAMYFFSIIAST